MGSAAGQLLSRMDTPPRSGKHSDIAYEKKSRIWRRAHTNGEVASKSRVGTVSMQSKSQFDLQNLDFIRLILSFII